MKIGAGAFMACLVAMLVIAAGASAKTLTLTGAFKGDGNSKLTMKVQTQHGKLKKIESFAFKNVDIDPSASAPYAPASSSPHPSNVSKATGYLHIDENISQTTTVHCDVDQEAYKLSK